MRLDAMTIGAGALSAALSVAAVLGIPGGALLSYVSALPLMAAGLAFGPGATVVAAAAGFAILALVAGVVPGLVYLSVHAVAAWLIVWLSLRSPATAQGAVAWRDPGIVLAWLTALAAAVALVLMLSLPGNQPLTAFIGSMLDQGLAAGLPGLDDASRAMVVSTIAPIFIGFGAATWIGMMAVNGVIAQAVVSRLGRARRPTPVWTAIRLPDALAWPLVAAAAGALVDDGHWGTIAANLFIVFAAPYFFAGLAAVHRGIGRASAKGPLTVAFYFLLMVLFLPASAIIAVAGMIDQWAGRDGGQSDGIGKGT